MDAEDQAPSMWQKINHPLDRSWRWLQYGLLGCYGHDS